MQLNINCCRFLYTDYSIGSVLAPQQKQGHKMHAVTYDIFCHWYPHFEERLAKYKQSLEITLPIQGLTGGIPKYHLAAHKDECYVRYSLNNMEGYGRLDGEALERIWSFMNEVSGSASEKGPGARIDQLNQLQDHWNWQKLISFGMYWHAIDLPCWHLAASYATEKYHDAKKMYQSTKASWTEFHEGLPREATQQWESMDLNPKIVNGRWTSVFMPQEPAGQFQWGSHFI